MSPSKFARKAWATLTGLGTAAIVAALAIGMTGWPPATAYAETPPVSTEGVSLSLTAESTASAGVTSLPAPSTVTSEPLMTEAKAKSLSKAPAPKKKVKKSTKPKKKAVKRIAWKTARVSWYGPGFYGNTMAGGGTLQPSSMVVAHRSLPFGTRVQFRYHGRTCVAVVRDRGPYIAGRLFDLGPGTAKALGFSGVGNVQYRILKR